MLCRECLVSDVDTQLFYCGYKDSFICVSCYNNYFTANESERLASAPVESGLVDRGYKPGLDLEIIPYHRSKEYEDVVSFENPQANEFYLLDRDNTLGKFYDLDSALIEYLKLSTTTRLRKI